MGAFRVVFDESAPRRTFRRDIAAAVVVAMAMFGAAIVLVLMTVPGPVGELLGAPTPAVRTLLSGAGVIALVGAAYRFVPRPQPAWGSLGVPAVVAGMGIFLVTAFFSSVGPIVFGSAQLYGAFGALFLGILWLGYVTQILLVGAAWVAERDVRAPATDVRRSEAPGL